MKKINIKDKFILGIGHGDSVLFEVIKIKGEEAILEMVDFGGPFTRVEISYLETLNKDRK